LSYLGFDVVSDGRVLLHFSQEMGAVKVAQFAHPAAMGHAQDGGVKSLGIKVDDVPQASVGHRI
jgi:hypothetical protein